MHCRVPGVEQPVELGPVPANGDDQVGAERVGYGPQRADGDEVEVAALDPAHDGTGDAGARRDVRLAQPGANPQRPDGATDPRGIHGRQRTDVASPATHARLTGGVPRRYRRRIARGTRW